MAHQTRIQVRYSETDQMGIAHHGSYVSWLELARIEYLKSLGISYKEIEKKGVGLVVAELNCRYKAPLYFEDECVIETEIQKLTPVSIVMGYRLVSQNQNIAHAEVKLACKTRAGLSRLPEEVFKALNNQLKG